MIHTRKKKWAFRLSTIGALLGMIAAASCSGDDVIELDVFDGGFDASLTITDATSDSPIVDAAANDAGVDAADSSAPLDSGTDSGVHVVLDSGSIVDSGNDSGLDASDDSGDASDDAGDGGDAGVVVNDCTVFEDDTDPAATRVIQGPPGSGPVQFTPSCMAVHAGQSVTFQQADFSNHPLMPQNGDTPNPITFTSSGTTVTIAFPNAGTFGFVCEFHPSLMFGAIEVTP